MVKVVSRIQASKTSSLVKVASKAGKAVSRNPGSRTSSPDKADKVDNRAARTDSDCVV